jgi:hypothetical protein
MAKAACQSGRATAVAAGDVASSLRFAIAAAERDCMAKRVEIKFTASHKETSARRATGRNLYDNNNN